MLPVFHSARTIVLDCGPSRTALGVFRRKGGRLCLEQYAARAFALPADPGDRWLENTCAAFQSLRSRMKVNGPVVLVLPAHAVLTKLVKTPRVAPAQREKIIRFEAEQKIPYALADVTWDSIVVSENESEMEVLLVAAKLELVEGLCRAAQGSGFHATLVLPSLLGTLAGFRLVQPGRDGSSLVLNLDTRSACLLLTGPAGFAGRTFSLGDSTAIPAPVENLHGDTATVGTIPVSNPVTGQPANIMKTLKTRLPQEITRSVLHFHWQGKMHKPGRLYLTGEGARLPGLGDMLEEALKIPVEQLDLLRAFALTKDATTSGAVEQAPTLTDLVGAAATQLRPSQLVVNLLPLPRRQLASLRRRRPWLIAVAALVIAALLPPMIHFRHVRNAAQKKTASIERELASLREREVRNRAQLQRLGEVRQQIRGLQNVYDRRGSWLGLFADLQDRLVRVEDVWLEKLQAVPDATDAPPRLLVSGRMLDKANPLSKVSPETFDRVKALLASVAASPFVGAVEATRFDNSQPGILRFDFVLVTNPQRPL